MHIHYTWTITVTYVLEQPRQREGIFLMQRKCFCSNLLVPMATRPAHGHVQVWATRAAASTAHLNPPTLMLKQIYRSPPPPQPVGRQQFATTQTQRWYTISSSILCHYCPNKDSPGVLVYHLPVSLLFLKSSLKNYNATLPCSNRHSYSHSIINIPLNVLFNIHRAAI